MKKVIFNADDFGFSKRVNEGILHTFKKGAVRDCSLILTMPAAKHAISLAKKNRLNVGLHLCLTDGKPLSKDKKTSLFRQGKFHTPYTFVARCLAGRIRKQDMRAELEAQIDAFLKTGLKPTHLDTHQYIHMLSPVFDVVMDVAHEYGIKALRVSHERHSSLLKTRSGSLLSLVRPQVTKGLLVSHLSKKGRSKLKKSSLKTTDHFFGIARIDTKNTLASFLEIVKNVPQGTSEIMCHPGFADAGLRKLTYYTSQREAEVAALTSKELRNCLKKHKIKLISFKDL